MPSAWLRVMGCSINQGDFRAPQVDLTGRRAVVTGPTIGGIGFSTASVLAKFGARVILAARNFEKGEAAAKAIKEELPDSQVSVHKCDVSDLDSVRAFANSLTASSDAPVDILVANAGAMPKEYLTNKEGVEIAFASAALGHHLLGRLLRPRRFVYVTGDVYCMSHGPADPFFKFGKGGGMEAYNRASLARMLLANETRRRSREASANEYKPEVVAVHPGVVASNFVGTSGFMKSFANMTFISVELGAQPSIYAATCPSSELPEDTFYFHNKRGWVKLPEDDLACDATAAKELYEKCDEVCGL